MVKENTNIRKFAEDCGVPVGFIPDCKLEDAPGSELRARILVYFLAALGLGFVVLWFYGSQLSIIFFEELAIEENVCIFQSNRTPQTSITHYTLPPPTLPIREHARMLTGHHLPWVKFCLGTEHSVF